MSSETSLENFAFEGILFDLDGTLVDSANAVRRYWEK
jgi:beta-phosphoglucomutase-like phosphatase (HAD superfamily)